MSEYDANVCLQADVILHCTQEYLVEGRDNDIGSLSTVYIFS